MAFGVALWASAATVLLAGCAASGKVDFDSVKRAVAGQSTAQSTTSPASATGNPAAGGTPSSVSMVRDALMVRYELPRMIGDRLQLRVGWGFIGRSADNPMQGGASCDFFYLADAFVSGGVSWPRIESSNEEIGHACARNEWALARSASPMNSPLRRVNALDPQVIEEQVKAFSVIRDARKSEIRAHPSKSYFFAGAGLRHGPFDPKTGALPLSITIPGDVFPPFGRNNKTVRLVGPGIGPDNLYHVKARIDPGMAREVSTRLAPFSGQIDHQRAVVSFQVTGGSEQGNTLSLNVNLLELAFDVLAADRRKPPITVTVPLAPQSVQAAKASRPSP